MWVVKEEAICNLCKETWERNQMVYMWVEDIASIEMHIEGIVALRNSTGKREIGQKLIICKCYVH